MIETAGIQSVVELYIASARGITQLATGALVATVVFSEKVLGSKEPLRVSRPLIASWFALLATIACGVLYEYLAIHYIGLKLGLNLERSWFPNYLEHNPGFVYGVMLGCFVLAALLFVLVAIGSLKKNLTHQA